MSGRRRSRIRLTGIVQGVGFRPFVYNLACGLGLGGYVCNSSAGLVAEVEGEAEAVARFLEAVVRDAPPLAWIESRDVRELPPEGADAFEIRPSESRAGEFALVSPDVATCAECTRDFRDPANRRYGYAFTNCTNCGPRYTIIRDLPYDRPNTTMAAFRMCAACQAEYDDPRDRRFHAQPNACPECGPRLSADIREVRRRLAEGEIVAVKGLGGFHLACDARNGAAVEALRRRKRRSDKPFAVMARDIETVEAICEVTDADREMLLGARRPIVILPRLPGAMLPDALAPGNRTLGVMLPYTPLHHLLFGDGPLPGGGPDQPDVLVMTSGNLSEEPIVVSNGEALERLAGVADYFLLHDRDIHMRTDDSVVRIYAGAPRLLRRSRSYAPEVMDLGRDVSELLACGGELKSAFCLTKGKHAILSQHIGDLENYETLVFFEETLANLKKLFRVTPRAVAHDLHPGYLSTRFAMGLDLPKIGVQHHHAHIAACMIENGLEGDVIGVACDGTGYGTDGAIWGGEFFTGGYRGFERRAQFRYVAMAGGDMAIREPWRAGLSYLMDAFGPDVPFAAVPEERSRVVRRMLLRGVNTWRTSSCGRLFDAVASIAGLRQQVNFEGQAAMELEAAAAPDGDAYPFAIEDGTIDFRPTIRAIVELREPAAAIAARFHTTVAAAIADECAALARSHGLHRVCLSGGTFQNWRLLDLLLPRLRQRGLTVFLHARVPPNDGGIALGQAALAAAALGIQ